MAQENSIEYSQSDDLVSVESVELILDFAPDSPSLKDKIFRDYSRTSAAGDDGGCVVSE